MNCRDFEPLIALDAGGDLAAEDAPRLDEHLRTCATCRELARDLAASHASLAALKTDEPDPAALTAWRQRVLDRVAATKHRPARRFVWAWAAAAAAAAVFVVALARVGPRETPPPPPVLVGRTPRSAAGPLAGPAGSEDPARTRASAPRPKRRVARRPAVHTAPRVHTEPLLVRLETSDPNVIIYWIAEGKGD